MNKDIHDRGFCEESLGLRRIGRPAVVSLFVAVVLLATPGQSSLAGPLQDESKPPPGDRKGTKPSGKKSPKKGAADKKAGGKSASAPSKPLPKNVRQEKKWQGEVGEDSRVLRTTHFAIVHNVDEEVVTEFSKILEGTYLACRSYALRLDLTVKRPKSKLLVIYFDQPGQRAEFLEKFGKEALPPNELGVYYPNLNISVFFNSDNAPGRKPSATGDQDARTRLLAKRADQIMAVHDSLIVRREASRHVLWNVGYYSRQSPSAVPRWLIEGTSRLFMKWDAGEMGDKSIVSYGFAGEYVSLSKADRHLPARDLISKPEFFTKQNATACKESWALVWYLSSPDHSAQFKQYILLIQDRPKDYTSTPEDEIATFEKAFGTLDAEQEKDWRAWMDRQTAGH